VPEAATVVTPEVATVLDVGQPLLASPEPARSSAEVETARAVLVLKRAS
jgi:hypothetical protein